MRQGPSYRDKLLADFENRYSPTSTLAGPGSAHKHHLSFLHALVGSSPPSTVLRTASETLNLSHIATSSPDPHWMRLPLQESFARLLPQLRVAMMEGKHQRSPQHQRDTLATIVALSLTPSELNSQRHLHLRSAATYLSKNGPSILALGDRFDGSLLQHVHIHSLCSSMAYRKRCVFNEIEWQPIPSLFVSPTPEFPAATRYMPMNSTASEFVLFSV